MRQPGAFTGRHTWLPIFPPAGVITALLAVTDGLALVHACEHLIHIPVAYSQAAVFTRGQHVSVKATGEAALSNAFEVAFDSAESSSAVRMELRRPAAVAPVALESSLAKSLFANIAPAGGLRWCILLLYSATIPLCMLSMPLMKTPVPERRGRQGAGQKRASPDGNLKEPGSVKRILVT